jgi:hypothetical protein
VSGDEESTRDGWVDVAPAHVPHSLQQWNDIALSDSFKS